MYFFTIAVFCFPDPRTVAAPPAWAGIGGVGFLVGMAFYFFGGEGFNCECAFHTALIFCEEIIKAACFPVSIKLIHNGG